MLILHRKTQKWHEDLLSLLLWIRNPSSIQSFSMHIVNEALPTARYWKRSNLCFLCTIMNQAWLIKENAGVELRKVLWEVFCCTKYNFGQRSTFWEPKEAYFCGESHYRRKKTLSFCCSRKFGWNQVSFFEI